MMKSDNKLDREERLHIRCSEKCNNNCIFCSDEDKKHERKMEISEEYVKRLLKEKKELKEVMFTFGEPTLNPKLTDYVRLAKGEGFEKIGIVTNGRLLKYPKNCINLLKSGINSITVSFHSTDKNIHEALTRSPGSYDQTLTAIKNLHQLKGKIDFEFFISFVVNNLNIKHLQKDIDFLGRYNFDCLILNNLLIRGRAKENINALCVKYTDLLNVLKKISVKENKTDMRLNDFPLCIFQDMKEYVSLSEEVHLEKEGRYENPNDHGRVKPEFCDNCKYGRSCPGVQKEYLDFFGDSEFLKSNKNG